MLRGPNVTRYKWQAPCIRHFCSSPNFAEVRRCVVHWFYWHCLLVLRPSCGKHHRHIPHHQLIREHDICMLGYQLAPLIKCKYLPLQCMCMWDQKQLMQFTTYVEIIPGTFSFRIPIQRHGRINSVESLSRAMQLLRWRYGSEEGGVRPLKDSPEPLTNYKDVCTYLQRTPWALIRAPCKESGLRNGIQALAI